MEFVKCFQKQNDRSYRCTTPVRKLDDNDVEHEQECGYTISMSKDSCFNLNRSWQPHAHVSGPTTAIAAPRQRRSEVFFFCTILLL